LLVKLPVPVPFVVLESLTVGLGVVAQQVPLAVMDPPPSDEIFPPETAVVTSTEVTAVVVSVGTTAATVVNERSFP
jgi:hypothetical protein